MTSLPADSYTFRRLEHATPEHLHATTTRLFIGPIPDGWLKSHRKTWFRHYVSDDSSRRPTFTAAHAIAPANHDQQAKTGNDGTEETEGRPSSQSGALVNGASGQESTTSLLHSQRAASAERAASPAGHASSNQGHAPKPVQDEPSEHEADRVVTPPVPRRLTSNLLGPAAHLSKPRVRFDEESKFQLRARAKRMGVNAKGRLRLSKIKDGEVLKTDKMLVRIDVTMQTLPEDYDEKASLGVETKAMDKWREFQVVCRKHTELDIEAVLQIYQTRVIQARDEGKVKTKPKAQIPLKIGSTRINLYSSLDKTLCLWFPKNGRTTIYYLRAESSATSVEWYTFLRGVLGGKRAQLIQVNIPELNVSLRLDNPFQAAEKGIEEAVEGDDEALVKAVNDESGAAGAIVTRCIDMLTDKDDWRDVLQVWAQSGRIGLAWKRYDRLEWIYGAAQHRMYGTLAMQRTHELELRPKEHYAQKARTKKGKSIVEPAPVEGYLIRLTTQQGQTRRLRKVVSTRWYFATQNQYLLFGKPGKSEPPPPPKMADLRSSRDVPSSRQLGQAIPLSYNVEPYDLNAAGEIAWLSDESVSSVRDQETADKHAADEAARNMNMLLSSDGFVNLCDVKRVRRMHRGASPADEYADSGSEVEFGLQAPSGQQEDGVATEAEDDRIFELLMNNGLVVRLQAFSKEARNLWMQQLQKLVKYWRARTRADMNQYKAIRAENLHALNLDERAEAEVGQYAQKWEVTQSQASPEIYNLCGIAQCRTIHLSGLLYRKPRRHTTFTRCHCILAAGHLLVFQDTLRKHSGRMLTHVHHERVASLDLHGCYLYSGLLTENDLLYQNQTFDSNHPGANALPKMYLEDGWHSIDEDANTTFVIWHPKSKQWFKSSQTVDDVKEGARDASKNRTKLKRVSQLGAKGQSIVFKARSRAERDHWVLSLQVEIERLASEDAEVRIVNEDDK